MKLQKLFDYYLNQHIRAEKIKGVTTAESNIKALSGFFVDIEAESLTRQHIRDYRDHRWQTVGNPTVARELSVLSKCLNIAVHEFDLDEDLVLDLRVSYFKPKCEPRKIYPSAEEIPLILKNMNVNMRRLFFASWRLGYRLKSETRILKWKNVNFDEGMLYLEDSKNGHSRTTPLDPEMIVFFKNLRREAERKNPDNILEQYIFVDKAGKQIETYNIYRPFRTAQKRAGMKDENGRWLYRPHDFRKAAAKWLLHNKKKPEKIVTRFYTGHRTVDIFRRHYDIEDHTDLQFAMELAK